MDLLEFMTNPDVLRLIALVGLFGFIGYLVKKRYQHRERELVHAERLAMIEAGFDPGPLYDALPADDEPVRAEVVRAR